MYHIAVIETRVVISRQFSSCYVGHAKGKFSESDSRVLVIRVLLIKYSAKNSV